MAPSSRAVRSVGRLLVRNPKCWVTSPYTSTHLCWPTFVHAFRTRQSNHAGCSIGGPHLVDGRTSSPGLLTVSETPCPGQMRPARGTSLVRTGTAHLGERRGAPRLCARGSLIYIAGGAGHYGVCPGSRRCTRPATSAGAALYFPLTNIDLSSCRVLRGAGRCRHRVSQRPGSAPQNPPRTRPNHL